MKAKIVVVLVVLIFIIGCSQFEHVKPDGTKFVYYRIGDLKMSGLHIEDTNGIYIGIDSIESEARLMTDAIEAAIKMYELGRAASP